MNTLRTNQKEPETLTMADAQRGFACNDLCFGDCPSLSYEPVISPDSDNRINKAFDILFEEVMRIRKSKKQHEISSHIRQGFDSPAGGGTNS